MSELAVTTDVAAPPERVWGVITDLGRSVSVITAITAIERLDAGGPFDVGTRWRETRTMFGREATEVMEVAEIDPGTSYTVEADGRGAHYRSTMRVEALGEGSRLSMTFGAEPSGTASRLMAATVGKLFEGSTRKALQQDLADIAAAAEHDA